MASSPRQDQAWQHLAALLIKRRLQLDPRYRNRRTFCTEREIDYRVISDIEGARRTNFRAAMITAIEVAYGLATGSIKKALAAPDLEKWDELPERVGFSHIAVTRPDEDHREPEAAQPWLMVIVNDDPEPEVPPGPPSGYSHGRLGGLERIIWAERDDPWQRRWAAIQMLRGQNAPIRQPRRPAPPERRADGGHRDPGREA